MVLSANHILGTLLRKIYLSNVPACRGGERERREAGNHAEKKVRTRPGLRSDNAESHAREHGSYSTHRHEQEARQQASTYR